MIDKKDQQKMILKALEHCRESYDTKNLIDYINELNLEDYHSIEEEKKKSQALDLMKSIEAGVLPQEQQPDFLLLYSEDKAQELFEKFTSLLVQKNQYDIIEKYAKKPYYIHWLKDYSIKFNKLKLKTIVVSNYVNLYPREKIDIFTEKESVDFYKICAKELTNTNLQLYKSYPVIIDYIDKNKIKDKCFNSSYRGLSYSFNVIQQLFLCITRNITDYKKADITYFDNYMQYLHEPVIECDTKNYIYKNVSFIDLIEKDNSHYVHTIAFLSQEWFKHAMTDSERATFLSVAIKLLPNQVDLSCRILENFSRFEIERVSGWIKNEEVKQIVNSICEKKQLSESIEHNTKSPIHKI